MFAPRVVRAPRRVPRRQRPRVPRHRRLSRSHRPRPAWRGRSRSSCRPHPQGFPAEDRRLVHRQQAPASSATSTPRPGRRGDPARQRIGAARCHRRSGRGAVDHRRWPERDRPRRPGDERGHAYPLPADAGTRTSTRRRSTATAAVVHRPERGLRPPRPGTGAPGLRRPGRPRSVRDRDHARRRVWYASLAGSHLARIDPATGGGTPSTRRPPARARVASGRTPAGGSGSASGTPARSRSTTRRPAVARVEAAGREPDDVRGLRRRRDTCG